MELQDLPKILTKSRLDQRIIWLPVLSAGVRVAIGACFSIEAESGVESIESIEESVEESAADLVVEDQAGRFEHFSFSFFWCIEQSPFVGFKDLQRLAMTAVCSTVRRAEICAPRSACWSPLPKWLLLTLRTPDKNVLCRLTAFSLCRPPVLLEPKSPSNGISKKKLLLFAECVAECVAHRVLSNGSIRSNGEHTQCVVV